MEGRLPSFSSSSSVIHTCAHTEAGAAEEGDQGAPGGDQGEAELRQPLEARLRGAHSLLRLFLLLRPRLTGRSLTRSLTHPTPYPPRSWPDGQGPGGPHEGGGGGGAGGRRRGAQAGRGGAQGHERGAVPLRQRQPGGRAPRRDGRYVRVVPGVWWGGRCVCLMLGSWLHSL